jgi:hypothetical protein
MSTYRKLGKLFRAIGVAVKNPASLNLLLDQEDHHRAAVGLYPEFEDGLPEVPFFSLVPEQATIEPYAFLDGGSLPTDLALLRALGKRGGNRYFEIGTWRGESVSNMAAIGLECTSLHLGSDQMRKRGWSESVIDMHEHFSSGNPAINHIHGDSRDFDFGPYRKQQDLVFVDGDHHYDSVVADTKTAFNLLRNEQSVIVWHDYGLSPEHVRWSVLHGILEGTPTEKRRYLYAVSNTLCAIYLPEKLDTKKRIYPSVPETYFSVELKKRENSCAE